MLRHFDKYLSVDAILGFMKLKSDKAAITLKVKAVVLYSVLAVFLNFFPV